MQARALLISILLFVSVINLPLNVLAQATETAIESISDSTTYSTVYMASDDEFRAARRAFDKKDMATLSVNLQHLQAQQYVLAPYVDYWLMLLQLGKAEASQSSVITSSAVDTKLTNFLEQYKETPFADRVRGEWLKNLAKRQDWVAFFNELPNFKRNDIAISCYVADGRWTLSHAESGRTETGYQETGQQKPANTSQDLAALEQAKSLWMVATEQPGNCDQLFGHMQQAGVLTEADIWARFRLALQAGKNTLAKNIIARLPAVANVANDKLLDQVTENPTLALTKKSISLKTRYGRELNLYALERIAQTNTALALAAYAKIEDALSNDEQHYFYGRLALQSARRLEPEALTWYKQVTLAAELSAEKAHEQLALDKEQLAWFVRSALRQTDWSTVLYAVNLMSADQQQEAVWRYWKARALKEQQQTVEANKIFIVLAKERHYYGWLAQDELGDMLTTPIANYKASDNEIEAIGHLPAIVRSEAFQRLEMRMDARAEWAWATRHFDDKQMLAAAEFAKRKQWHDLAILTADKTMTLHDFDLRYPTPYRDLMKVSANNQDIDEAWVYGIARQESRFMHYAKSGVGASGLMQLMPATAKWIAKRAGWNNYSNSMIHDLDTNVQLGTYYLRYTLDLMNGKALMATAAYNAGPSRAKKWLAIQPLEGAIYAETIPFSETRNYVQKVMANAQLYASRLGLKNSSLKQRLGVVPGRVVIETITPETSNQAELLLVKTNEQN